MLITAIRPFRPVLPEETYIYIARSIRFAETGVAWRGPARRGVLIIIGALPATHKTPPRRPKSFERTNLPF